MSTDETIPQEPETEPTPPIPPSPDDIVPDVVKNNLFHQDGKVISLDAAWIAHGRRYRTQEQINHIYKTHCSECEYHADATCLLCSRRLAAWERSASNLIAMETTNCPIPNNPKWISPITPPENLHPEIAKTLKAETPTIASSAVPHTPPVRVSQPGCSKCRSKFIPKPPRPANAASPPAPPELPSPQ